jgi:hypothetical protein
VSSAPVVEDLQVLEDRVREFDSCLPSLAVGWSRPLAG